MRAISLLSTVLFAACPGLPTDSGDDPDTDIDTADAPPLTDLPTGVCSDLEYDWVPLGLVGRPLSWERAPELDLSAQAINGLLTTAGYPAGRLDVAYDVEVYRMRYSTQDRGETIEATAIVSVPDTDGDVPTVAWLHGTTGFTDACAPSAMGLEGAAGNLLLSSLGNVVVSPDYIGMNGFGPASTRFHPYMVAEPAAVGSLDAIRAAWTLLSELDTDAQPTRDTILFGGSEGGFTALWSERYAPWYLPSANVKGVVASVPPTDLVHLSAIGATELQATSLALAAALTSYHDWYGWEAPLDTVLTDTEPNRLASRLYELMDGQCDVNGDIEDPASVDEVYTEAFRDAAAAGTLADFEDWGCALEANSLVSAPFERISDTPVYYVISGNDTLVDSRTNRADVPVLCEQGYQVEAIECEGASHSGGAVASLHLQWRWAAARLADEPITPECGLAEPIDCEAAE